LKNDLETMLELYEESEEHLDNELREFLKNANNLAKEF
jgi:hypothetical protein